MNEIDGLEGNPPVVTQADVAFAEDMANAINSFNVAYTHDTLADMSTANRSWKVHEAGNGNPFDRNEWLGEFDNKADANALCSELRKNAAEQCAARHREASIAAAVAEERGACAAVAECAFDERGRSRVGHPSQMDWEDGYRDATRQAAHAIRSRTNTVIPAPAVDAKLVEALQSMMRATEADATPIIRRLARVQARTALASIGEQA